MLKRIRKSPAWAFRKYPTLFFVARSFAVGPMVDHFNVFTGEFIPLCAVIIRLGSHVFFAWIHCTDVRINCTGILIEYK